jgi:hypothetical protein
MEDDDDDDTAGLLLMHFMREIILCVDVPFGCSDVYFKTRRDGAYFDVLL